MLKYVAIVDQGLVHRTNDDAALLNHSLIHNGFFSGESECDVGIFGVADGIGSVHQSELASRIALGMLQECDAGKIDDIVQIITASNEKLVLMTEERNLSNTLSTTLCVVSVLENRIISFNLGNSRLYRYRNGYLKQLTKDQTKVQSLIDLGIIDREMAKSHPEKNLLSGFLGDEQFTPGWIDVIRHDETFQKNDILFLCSDGLHEYVDTVLLEEILGVEASLSEKAEVMVRCTLDKGGNDNASVVLIAKE